MGSVATKGLVVNKDGIEILSCVDCAEQLISGSNDNPDWPGLLPWVSEYFIEPSGDTEMVSSPFPCNTCNNNISDLRIVMVGYPST